MSLQMEFKGFRWSVNPSEIALSCGRNLEERALPFSGSHLQELGRKKRQVSGKGCFLGKDSLRQFRELQRLFEEGGAGMLFMPGFPPFRAVFSSLQLQAAGRPEETRYTFSFLEEDAPPMPEERAAYTCREHDSLWRAAAAMGVPLEALLEQNRILWANDLEEGTVLRAVRPGRPVQSAQPVRSVQAGRRAL